MEILNSSSSITLLNKQRAFSLGTSIPTAALPGIGASILIPEAAKLRAISSDKLHNFTNLYTLLGCNS